MRKQLQNYAVGSSGQVIETYLFGNMIDQDWVLDWHDPNSMREKEIVAEKALREHTPYSK